MTPLFAATQSSQSVSADQSLGSSGASVQLRATQQALAFTPTQGQAWYPYSYTHYLIMALCHFLYLKK